MDETKFRNIQKIMRQQARECNLIRVAADTSPAEGCAAQARAFALSAKHWEAVREKHGYTREDFDLVEAANESYNESIRHEER